MQTYRQFFSLIFVVLSANAVSAQEREFFGWWKIEASENYQKFLQPAICYVFISSETITIVSPAAQIVGDFAIATLPPDAWSHDIKAFTSVNDELYMLLDAGMRAKVGFVPDDNDRLTVEFVNRNGALAAKGRTASSLKLVRAASDVALQDVLKILGDKEFQLSKATIAEIKRSGSK